MRGRIGISKIYEYLVLLMGLISLFFSMTLGSYFGIIFLSVIFVKRSFLIGNIIHIFLIIISFLSGQFGISIILVICLGLVQTLRLWYDNVINKSSTEILDYYNI